MRPPACPSAGLGKGSCGEGPALPWVMYHAVVLRPHSSLAGRNYHRDGRADPRRGKESSRVTGTVTLGACSIRVCPVLASALGLLPLPIHALSDVPAIRALSSMPSARINSMYPLDGRRDAHKPGKTSLTVLVKAFGDTISIGTSEMSEDGPHQFHHGGGHPLIRWGPE